MTITVNDEIEGIRRIGTTPDGYLLRRYLQRALNDIPPEHADGCALQRHTGRRTFARELRTLLDQGVAEAEQRDRTDDAEPFIVSRAEPVAIERGGARRRVADYDDAGST